MSERSVGDRSSGAETLRDLRARPTARPLGQSVGFSLSLVVALLDLALRLRFLLAPPGGWRDHVLLRVDSHLLAPTIVDGSGVTQESGRKVLHPWGLIRRRLIGSGPAPGGSQATPPDWIAGTFLLFRADTFRRLQGMDERFHLYFEDVDLGCRATLQGMRLQIAPDVRVVHEARRASARSLLYLLQHAGSALRFFRSPVYREMGRRARARGILEGGPRRGENDR